MKLVIISVISIAIVKSSDDITVYSEYINLTKSLLSAQENLTRNQIHVSLLLQVVSLLQTAFSNANESYYINIKVNESLTAETSIISEFQTMMNTQLLDLSVNNLILITKCLCHIICYSY